ncbi:DNA/RNA polymerase, partial [Dissoconium aciculare CBS 342.82]|uniref:DNA polymerase eta n=1 Tax=Dissoconium aciculare CBS 342.82 TaxID=1314786 RepID=A0A6J3M219_9PEZI
PRSKFTYRDLSAMARYAITSPLRVISLIDLDAFYAQCETVRLGLDPSIPLAVQQWQGLIALNYPSRAFGLNRHVTVAEAKEKCPELVCQHVATWKEGDTKWSYSEDAWREIAIRKVSLDPYRMESRKILAVVKESLPADKQRVEKASVDEMFMDLSAHVHGLLLERYPELRGPPPYDDPTERLPRPSSTALDWAADGLIDLDTSQSEEDDPDWDDVALMIASEIVRDVRAKIYEKLRYTCSAGLSRNKMLAKLGAGHKKPNGQTIIRNRAVQQFLSGYKFTKIRNLGGKLGDEVVAAFNTDIVSDLLPVPVEQLKKRLGDDTGTWVYNIIRGEDHSEVNPRTQIKSMLSAKSFRPSINTLEAAVKWIRIFVADIFGRLVEEGVLEHKRRPRTIVLHHRQGAQTRSKGGPIPLAKTITEELLFDLAKNLLAQVVGDGRAWPCANLSLSVGGFEEGITGNKGIGGFLVRGDEAKALMTSSLAREDSGERAYAMSSSSANKRRKIGATPGIAHFFGAPQQRHDGAEESKTGDEANPLLDGEHDDEAVCAFHDLDESATNTGIVGEERGLEDPFSPPTSAQQRRDTLPLHRDPPDRPAPPRSPYFATSTSSPSPSTPPAPPPPRTTNPSDIASASTSRFPPCPRCNRPIPPAEQAEHDDFHFAQDLQDATSPARPPPKPIPPPLATAATGSSGGSAPRGRGRPPASAGGPEKGQKRLAFG